MKKEIDKITIAFHFGFVSVLQKKKCYRPSGLGFHILETSSAHKY